MTARETMPASAAFLPALNAQGRRMVNRTMPVMNIMNVDDIMMVFFFIAFPFSRAL